MKEGNPCIFTWLRVLMTAFLALPPLALAGSDARGQETAQETRRNTVVAVGDIMLSGSAAPVLQTTGYGHAFRDPFLSRLVGSADVAFANLEHPVTGSSDRYKDKKFTFRGTSASLRAIKKAGLDMLSLANNHIMDYGATGLMDTIVLCRKLRLACSGAGADEASARRLAVFERRGVRYGLLAYSMTFPEDFWATPERPGTAHPDITRLELDIRQARPEVDILIVSFHWGEELMTEPKQYQVGFARYAVRTGADMVIGHHPHVSQAIEIYRGKPIFYSLGNYAFGTYSAAVSSGLAVETVFQGKDPVQVNIYPLNVCNREVRFQPRLARDQAALQAITHLQDISSPFNTVISFDRGVGTIAIAPKEDESTAAAPADETIPVTESGFQAGN